MNNLNKLGSAVVLALSLVGCGGKGSDSTSKPATAPATAAVSAAPAVASPAPPECEAYIERVGKCVDKISASNPAAAVFKQQLETSRAQWAAMTDKAALASVCTRANEAFNQSAQALKCE
jgi:hypothetical protein